MSRPRPASPPRHPRRGDHLRRAARGRLDPHRRGAAGADRARAAPGLRGARRRSGPRSASSARRARPRAPRVRAGAGDRAGDRRGGLRGDHRRRARADGGRQPRRPGGRRDLGRAQHPAAARAGAEPYVDIGLTLRLLLHPQADVRPLLALDRRPARRLRHARRAVRGADPDPDRRGDRPPGRPRRQRLLVGAARLGARGAARRRADLAGGLRDRRRSPTTSRRSSPSPCSGTDVAG